MVQCCISSSNTILGSVVWCPKTVHRPHSGRFLYLILMHVFVDVINLPTPKSRQNSPKARRPQKPY